MDSRDEFEKWGSDAVIDGNGYTHRISLSTLGINEHLYSADKTQAAYAYWQIMHQKLMERSQ